jgi:hypothetical protein
MRRTVAGLLTAIIMGLVLWSGLARSPSPSQPATDPGIRDSRLPNSGGFDGAASRIEALLASARQGDVAAYLSAFGGPLRARLDREAGEHGSGAFALGLRRAGLARKSHAIFAPEPDGDREGAARITVELTFADRLERQTFRLERGGAGWLIIEVETARERVPINALGSPASFHEPEGIPVAAGSVEPVGDAIKDEPDM